MSTYFSQNPIVKRALLLISICFIFLVGCQKNGIVPEETIVEDEYVDVGVKASFIDYNESPMVTTKAFSDRDIFAVEIHDEDAAYYACWLTSDLKSDKIKLLRNKRYICYLVYMPSGQDIIDIYDDGTAGMPFCPMGYVTVNAPKLNKGVFYGNYSVDFCNSGCAQKKGLASNGYGFNGWSDIDIYYGITEIYSDKDIDLTVDMYRMMFGLKVEATNLREGVIRIANNDPSLATYSYRLTPTEPSMDKVLQINGMPFTNAFPKPSDVPSKETMMNWSFGTELIIDYVDSKGNVFKIYNKGIETKRLTKYTFSIDMDKFLSEYNSSLSANIVEDHWTDVTLE